MKRLLTILSALLGAVLLTGAPSVAYAQPVTANAKVKVNIKKPLVITAVQDLEFGNIILPSTPGTFTISMAQDGTLTCPATVTCSGVSQPAIYNLTGSHKQVADVQVAEFDMVNPLTGEAIRFYPDAPTTVNLPNSGNKGADFNIGGSFTVPASAEGAYEGTITVIADYQ